MKMQRLNIQLPVKLKTKLDAERKRGTSAAGLIEVAPVGWTEFGLS
jgi:hypothetical protein